MYDLVDPDTVHGLARPEKLTVDFYEEPDGIAIHQARGGGPGAFLLLWLIGWTVGCVWLGAEVVNNPGTGLCWVA